MIQQRFLINYSFCETLHFFKVIAYFNARSSVNLYLISKLFPILYLITDYYQVRILFPG